MPANMSRGIYAMSENNDAARNAQPAHGPHRRRAAHERKRQMIEVTDEMVAEGVAAWLDVGGGSTRERMTAAYRAMRPLEPVAPELRNRQAPPPARAGDVGMRPEDRARGFNSPTWGANAQAVYNPTQGGGGDGVFRPEEGNRSAREFEARQVRQLHQVVAQMFCRVDALETKPVPDPQAMVDANGGTFTQRKIQRRIDALTALVLELVTRSQGYPPGDATLQRLIAELEPTP